jgi:hypothetical protein
MNRITTLLLVLGLCGCGGGSSRNVDLSEIDHTLSVDRAFELIDQNQPKFFHTYGHKVVQMTGRVGELKNDKIEVIGTRNTMGGLKYVSCYFSGSQKSLVFDLNKGQSVTITGYLDPTENEKYNFTQPSLSPCQISR